MCSSSGFLLVTTLGPKPKQLTLEDLGLPRKPLLFIFWLYFNMYSLCKTGGPIACILCSSSSSFPLVTTLGPKPKPLTLEDLGLPGKWSAIVFCFSTCCKVCAKTRICARQVLALHMRDDVQQQQLPACHKECHGSRTLPA
jgi:hypothetical protein